jgi:histidyl-tRNA synthetase
MKAASGLYYMGPMFRHERPQRGRYQPVSPNRRGGAGFGGPEVDAELILLACALWKALGLTDVRLGAQQPGTTA